MAYPPFTPFIARIGLELFGNSVRGLRVFSAIAQGIVMVLAGLMARDMGGRRNAQVMSAVAVYIAPDELKIRLEPKHAEECEDVWKRVYVNTRGYLTQQGLDNVRVVRAAEPPMRDPKSGKFHNIWMEKVGS